jgi:type I restriction enzyme S subunit
LGEFRRYISDLAIRASSTNVVKSGNLLIVTRTGVGKIAIAPCDVAISQDITGVYVDPEQVDVGYLFFFMIRGTEELKKLNQGTSINGIIRRDLERYPVWAPTNLPEQRYVVEILRAISRAIENTDSLIAKYQKIKTGLMHDLFTRGLDENGQLRPPHGDAPEMYKRTTIGWIPREWGVGDLKSKSSPRRAHLKTGPFGSSLKGEHWTDEGRPVITIGALGEGFLSESELLYVSEATATRLAEYQLIPGDIVFSRVADVGRSAVIENEHLGWIMSSNLMRISVDHSVANPKYLQQLLSHDSRLKRQIRAKVNSGGREIANSAVLNQLSFPWPDVSEQDRIVEAAALLDNRIRLERNQVLKLTAEKTGIMRDLLIGNVLTCTSEPVHV